MGNYAGRSTLAGELTRVALGVDCPDGDAVGALYGNRDARYGQTGLDAVDLDAAAPDDPGIHDGQVTLLLGTHDKRPDSDANLRGTQSNGVRRALESFHHGVQQHG